MSRFTADWLRLREPFDAAARDTPLLESLGGWRQGRGELVVIDLGAGTGANLRFTAPRLGGPQRWVLVDHDPDLLGLATAETRAWARAAGLEVRAEGAALRLQGPALDCRLRPLRADLAAALDDLPLAGCDLVAASALLDLVSPAWLGRLLERARANGCALLITLTYDGRVRWDPAEAEDDQVLEHVNRHQRTDKGFGPALGPEAVDVAVARLERAGYRVMTARSDWRIGPGDRPIQRALLEGWVAAAREVDPCAGAWIEGWRARRLRRIDAGRSGLTVGHRDLFATAE